MPLDKITLRPGVNSMATPTLNAGGWSDASLVRFRGGLPEKWGGWTKFVSPPLIGKCRALLAFNELAGDKLLGAGTNSRLYMVRGNVLYDITPIDRTVATTLLATTNGSTVLTVTTGTPHGLAVGDWITFDSFIGMSRTASGITLGGQPLTGDYEVAAITSTTVCTVRLAAAATTASTATPATVTCYLPSGPADATPGLGWGAGGWGLSGWGVPSTVPANMLPARIWSLDSWGQAMLGVPTQERLFLWAPDASGNVSSRAAVVTCSTPANGPPLRINMVLAGSPERHAILLGCSDLNSALNYDGMLVRWSDVEDYTTYRATATNSAGSFRLQGGSTIVGAFNANLQTLIWTDLSMHSMRFIGLPYVYSFNKLGMNCGLIAQRAYGEINGTVFWMSQRNFWRFQGGTPELLDCTMLEEVYARLTVSQKSKIVAGTNASDGEVIWFYPADGSQECNRYVAYNSLENCWYGGDLARTAWADSEIFDHPIGCDPSGQLFNHEDGQDADGAPMGDFVQSGYWDMSDGEMMIFADRIIPDFADTAAGRMRGTLQIMVLVQDYPNGRVVRKGPFTVTAGTPLRGLRARGRQMAIRIESVGTGGDWRLGAVRVNYQPDGMR